MQRVLGFHLPFLMARQMQDLVLVAHSEVAGDRQLAGWTVVVDSVTRLAELLMRRGGSWRPVPAPLVEHDPALRADRGLP